MEKKLAIVFGGSRGIGRACVHALADDGYDVAWTYVSRPSLRVAAAGQRAYPADVRDPQDVARVFSDARRDFGAGPSCVIANAGINVPPASVAEFELSRFRDLIEVNLVGAFNVLSEAARQTLDGGSIIGITTSMVRVAVQGGGPYTASKAAVESLLRSMAKELSGRGIRVNGVAPGPVETDLFNAGKTDQAKARAAALSPFDRIGTPDEIATVAAFLASERASWISGQIVQPNGGMV